EGPRRIRRRRHECPSGPFRGGRESWGRRVASVPRSGYASARGPTQRHHRGLAAMYATTIRRIVLGSVGLALPAAALAAEQGAQKPHSRAEFMRMKLEFSKKVLEGLTLEDYPAISKNAKALKRLSEAAEWEVPTIPNATDYVIFTTEFQRLTDEMDRKAKD